MATRVLSSAAVIGDFSSAAALDVKALASLASAGVIGDFTHVARIALPERAPARYSELINEGFLGATRYARGPESTLAIAGPKAGKITFLNTRNPEGPRIVDTVDTGNPPVDLASTESYLYALLEEQTAIDAVASLRVWPQTSGAAYVADNVFRRGERPWSLWGPDDAYFEGADFIVVCTQQGNVQIRAADSSATLRCEQQTGLRVPRVAMVRKREDLSPGTVWDILIAEETGAGVYTLRYSNISGSKHFTRIVSRQERTDIEGALQLTGSLSTFPPERLGAAAEAPYLLSVSEQGGRVKRWTLSDDGELTLVDSTEYDDLRGADYLPGNEVAASTDDGEAARGHQLGRTRKLQVGVGLLNIHGQSGRVSRVYTGPLVSAASEIGAFVSAANIDVTPIFPTTARVWYTFENTDATTVYDETANNNDGSLSGFTPSDFDAAYGKVGKGALFSGGSIDSIEVPHFIAVDQAAFSIAFWHLRTTSQSGVQPIFRNRRTGAGGRIDIIHDTTDRVQFNALFDDVTQMPVQLLSAAASFMTWHHIAIVVSRPTWTFYVDGSVIATRTDSGADLLQDNNVADTTLGTQGINDAPSMYFDEFFIFDRALDVSEIAYLYAVGGGT